MDEAKESLQVPGTWALSRPGYRGVAWHWRPLDVPETWEGHIVRLRFEAVRLQAVVYLDREPVGYDLEGYTPFEIDLTDRVRPGVLHDLAVRVTNPGGSTSALDWAPVSWAGCDLPPGHDFGGLWGDVALIATAPAYIAHIRVAPQAGAEVSLSVELMNRGPRCSALIRASLYDARGAQVAEEHRRDVALPADALCRESFRFSVPSPQGWYPGHPALYTAVVSLEGDGFEDRDQVTWGFRLCRVRDGQLDLQDRQVPLRAAFSSGWYPQNLAFPAPRLAEREVRAALDLGLHALVMCEQPATPALLSAADRAGLLILEPAASRAASAAAPHSLRWVLDRERSVRLERRDGNHPCRIRLEAPLRSLGEPLLFSALPDLPRLVQRYGDITLPGSDAEHWSIWMRALQEDFAAYGLARTFPDLSALCRATAAMAGESLEQKIERSRLASASTVIDGWAIHPTEGAVGLVDSYRYPQGNEYILRRAYGPVVLLDGLPAQMRSGQDCAVVLWVLDDRLDVSRQLRVRLELLTPEGQVALAEERVATVKDAECRICLGELRLRPGGEGAFSLHIGLLSGEHVLYSATRSFWVTAAPEVSLATVRCLDPAGLLPGWCARSADRPSAGPARNLLIVGAGDPQREALLEMSPQQADRVALLLPASGVGPGMLEAIARNTACPALTAFALREGRPGGWVYGHRHPLLAGVADPGIWGAMQRDLLPATLFRGLPADALVGGCSFPGWPHDPAAPPRLGMALGILPLGLGELLLCTLPVIEGLDRGLPLAERLLANIVSWLDA